MKTMHSLPDELMNGLTLLANTEFLRRCTDFDEEKIAKLASGLSFPPDLLLAEEKSHCLTMTAEAVSKSGLTNGYDVPLNEIRGILFMWPMITIIAKNVTSNMDSREFLNFFNDLADNAGHHVQLFSEESYDEGFLEHFNSKIPEYFTHKINATELYLLACYYAFGSNYLEYQDDSW